MEVIQLNGRSAQEVFAELRHRLESTGYLPEEYFELDREWQDGRAIPEGSGFFCTTDYGPSEGVYLDVYLKWYEEKKEEKEGKREAVIKSFATGKTLGESGSDLDRMFLISSAITKAFHGDGDGVHARCVRVRVGGAEKTDAVVMHLSESERRVMIDSLVENRNRLVSETDLVERLLRRVTGGIIEFVNEAGARPLTIDDFDMAVLAVQDGNLVEFAKLYNKQSDRMDELLLHTASRPGTVGRKMTVLLLSETHDLDNTLYLKAMEHAIGTGDTERVLTMAQEAEHCVKELGMSFYGDAILHATSQNNPQIARALLEQCTNEQIAAARPYLLVQAFHRRDSQFAFELMKKGISTNVCAGDIIRICAANHDAWMVRHCIERGYFSPANYPAMRACIKNDCVDAALSFLELGTHFGVYEQWAEESGFDDKKLPIYEKAKEAWERMSGQDVTDVAPAEGGIRPMDTM